MVNKLRVLFLSLLVAALVTPSFAEIKLKVGQFSVAPASIGTGSCLQVPVFMNDGDLDQREIKLVTITFEINGDISVIEGGLTAVGFIANAFTSGDLTGITASGAELTYNYNAPGAADPTCAAIFNPATEGGTAADFAAGDINVTWTVNTNQGSVGRKQAVAFDLFNTTIVTPNQNEDLLIAVLEIPLVDSPGPSQLLISATPESDVNAGNVYSYDDGLRVDENGDRALINEFFDLTEATNVVINLFEAEDCAGASIADDNAFAGAALDDRGAAVGLNFIDPEDGGNGGEITFTLPHSSDVGQIRIEGTDGFSRTIVATGTETTLTINTVADGSPVSTADVSYDVFYEVEFPVGSGTWVPGAACTLETEWNDVSCTIVSDPANPTPGDSTDFDVTLTNAKWDGAKYGTITLPDSSTVDLVNPTSTASNVFTFDNAHNIPSIGLADAGTYTVAASGPGVGNTTTCQKFVSFQCPENDIVCSDIPGDVMIGGAVTIPLVGNFVVDWDITYDGTTVNLPGTATEYNLSGLVGNVTDVMISANGFDDTGSPCSDDVTCTLDFADATCVASQDSGEPGDPVDVGAPIVLTLNTTGAVSVVVNGIAATDAAMTPDVDPNMNDAVVWTYTYNAIADETVTATVTNPDGTETTCTWEIDINCVDPTIVFVPPVGETGIVIAGTVGCTYDVTITEADGTVTTIPIEVTIDDGSGLGTGTGVNNSNTIPVDAEITISQQGGPDVGNPITTVPTLGEWGMIAFMILLMGSALLFMRKSRLA